MGFEIIEEKRSGSEPGVVPCRGGWLYVVPRWHGDRGLEATSPVVCSHLPSTAPPPPPLTWRPHTRVWMTKQEQSPFLLSIKNPSRICVFLVEKGRGAGGGGGVLVGRGL